MINIEFEVADLVQGLEAADDLIGRNVREALDNGADMVAARAKSHHDFTDRSKVLKESIQSDGVSGSWASGDLTAAVSAGAPHAAPIEFGSRPHVIRPRHKKRLRWPVEGGFQFATEVHHPGNFEYGYLRDALEDKLPEIVEEVEAAVELGFHQAGFR